MIFNRLSRPPIAVGLEEGLEAARRRRLERAGLRCAPRGEEPTGAFVAIEMAVLVIVSALAMVSVIVTTCLPAEARAVAIKTRTMAIEPHGPPVASVTPFVRPETHRASLATDR